MKAYGLKNVFKVNYPNFSWLKRLRSLHWWENTSVNKKTERQNAKKNILKEL